MYTHSHSNNPNNHHHDSELFPLYTTTHTHAPSNSIKRDVDCCRLLTFFICCGALATTTYNSPRAGLRFISSAIAIVATIVIISCLASLAMSATGEALLSLLLIGIVAAALVSIFQPREERGIDENYYSRGSNIYGIPR